jgi:dTDP-glucose 4,6-dehydratase
MSDVVVTGGCGFVGSHLVGRLLDEGHHVTVVDTNVTGPRSNLIGMDDNVRLRVIRQDVESVKSFGTPEVIYHLASPASPVDYLDMPIQTLRVNALGTLNVLEEAVVKGCRVVIASTSEVYGDPLVHPQPESYWGNVNPIGPRSVYDEAKRFAEALTFAYHREYGVSIGVARIFNTYGPRMRSDDGRAVPTFVRQALAGKPLTVHGDGSQTRSLCYVDDLVDGLVRLGSGDVTGPINIGSTDEITMLELAQTIISLTGSDSEIVLTDKMVDDPQVRRPDITLAEQQLGWKPTVDLTTGLERTIGWWTS